jgi:hypothetical protein
MSTTLSSLQSKSARQWAAEEPSDDATVRPADMGWLPSKRLPLGKRASRVRLLITFCIGVVATLAWQSYGDAAREMIASSSPRLGWLAPPAAPVTQAAPAVPSPDQEDLKAISFGLAGVRQRVDQIAAQLAAGQDQMTRDIGNKLQAVEQDILDKMISAPPPQPAAAPARKPVPSTFRWARGAA